VRAIYIHKITGRELPKSSIPFVTAYDIAMREFLYGRLTENQAADVGDAVLKSEEATFLPVFQHCPSPKEYEQIADLRRPLTKTLADLKKKIEVKMINLCRKRTNTNNIQTDAAAQCR
jgi:hypothetical protein